MPELWPTGRLGEMIKTAVVAFIILTALIFIGTAVVEMAGQSAIE